MDKKIIYVVVAETVQHPLTRTIIGDHLARLDNTRTIVQVPGRLGAQAAHVVSKMRYTQLAHEFEALIKLSKNRKRVFGVPPFTPITTIILGARDSFELEHVYNLLRKFGGIMTYKFEDT